MLTAWSQRSPASFSTLQWVGRPGLGAGSARRGCWRTACMQDLLAQDPVCHNFRHAQGVAGPLGPKENVKAESFTEL